MSEIKESERSDESTYDLDAIPGMPGEDGDEELEQPSKPNPALGQPLPRLWKGEPEPSEETDPGRPLKKAAKGGDEDKPSPKKASTPRVKAPKPKAKPRPADDGDETDKKVLIEDTPRFDTIEARQRARLIVGGLGVFCVMLACYIGYRVLFGGGGSVEADLSGEEPPMVAQAPPGARPSLENEARYMLNRARELAKAGRTDQAVGMLTRIAGSYKGTESAAEARAALARPSQNLPLFPDGPAVVAERKPVAPPPAKAATPGKPSGPPPTATAPTATGPPPVAMSPQPQPAQPQTTPTPPARAQLAPPPNVLAQMTPPPTAPAQPTPPPRAQAQTTPPPRAQMQLAPSPAVQAQTIPPPAPATQPQPVPSQPVAQAQPTQPAPPPPGPGQVAMIVPANPPARTEAPTTVERPADGGAGVAPRSLTRRELPPGFKARAEAGYHESGWPRIIVGDRDGGPMVLVPGGTFTMGSDKGEPVEAPAHTVRLSTFYIDQYEVTNKQFRTFLDDSRRGLPPGKWHPDEKPRDAPPAAPAVFVNWRDAEAFAIWAGKRLPTEAQWEMAARSTDGRRYPWGDLPIKSSRPREFGRVDPVGSFAEDSSVYGAFDMAGNVMEWTRDWYEPKYFQKVGDKIPENPTGPSSKRQNSIQRVVKGGSKSWTVSFRQGVDLDKRAPNLGFRCSLAVEGPEASAGISPHPVKPEAQPGTPPPGAGPPGGGDVPF